MTKDTYLKRQYPQRYHLEQERIEIESNEKADEKNKNKKKKRMDGERNETEDKKGARNGTKIALDIPLSCLSSAWLG